ncbi:MAG: tetratricopeptide repeat protein [Caldilineaceae bacterium]|nr:tetratricopeptide repeat protein [Caldilineaceae bacterium]
MLEEAAEGDPEMIRRALQGRGLAYESLLDPRGVVETYRRLQQWARQHGDRQLMLTTYGRLSSILGLMGQQRESDQFLGEMFDALASGEGDAHPSRVIQDLHARRSLIYSLDPNVSASEWAAYTEPPPAVSDPVADILNVVEPVHAVLPLFDYGWTLLVQGQLGEATQCLEAVVDLASETAQPSIASIAYHQLAITARILGDTEQSHALNEQSIAINREVGGAASELASMWPRIASAFLSLQAGRLDEAERRVKKSHRLLGKPRWFQQLSQQRQHLSWVGLAGER